ncbi:MAG: Stp1/IreP family PP2C-type Ser/Thr phosphatase [Acidobacteriia bacterium]|nr:Stp1/IreP family PP2C-type Ser/Thr phosphatase [Terriglobia bacterium]
MKIQVAQASHIGMHRRENQDSVNYVNPEGKRLQKALGCLLMVADGMGGAAGGKVASEMAVSIIPNAYFQYTVDPLESLKHAFESANTEIFQRSQHEPALRGMGTTVTAVAFIDGRYISAHIGDTRLYRLREHTFERLTADHSMVAQMVREGLIQEEDARHHPHRNVLLRSMGIQENLVVDFQSDHIKANDLYVLCTDGLHGLVEDNEIAAITDANPPKEACELLVNLANERGGFDNITVQIAQIESTGWLLG